MSRNPYGAPGGELVPWKDRDTVQEQRDLTIAASRGQPTVPGTLSTPEPGGWFAGFLDDIASIGDRDDEPGDDR